MTSLDSPVRMRCGTVIPNRIALAPLTNTQSQADGTLGDDEYRWLMARARGGFGLLSTCATFVSKEGQAWKGQLGASSDTHLPGLTRLATGLRSAGAMPIVQLHHGGDKAELAPELKLGTADGPGVKGASIDDLSRVVDDYVAAALRVERAGFAGVEIHGANGYLFTQFLAPGSNPRTDGYGGSLAGRARLLREATQAVRSAVSPGFIVGVRLSPVDLWAPRGLVLSDSVQVGQWMAEDGVDFVHLSLKDAAGPPPHDPDAGSVARAFRDALPDDVLVTAAGGIWTRKQAGRAVDEGVDIVVLGRAAIIHPDWPRVSATDDWMPTLPPWKPDDLRGADVGGTFLGYLSAFPGMVVGGAEQR